MKILITGDKGFIGSHLSKSLIDDGHEVIGWDKKDNKNILHITSEDIGYADKIVHLAARANVKKSLEVPQTYYMNNVLGTRAVFEAAEYVGVPVIFASSSTAAQWWLSPYGTTKKMTEVISDNYLQNVALRFSNVYGDGQRDTMLFQRMINDSLEFVSNNHVRDFIHVDDVVDAIKIFLYAKQFEFDRIYDVGTGEGLNVNNLVEDYGFNVEERVGESCEMLDNTADITKLTRLGWSPKRDIHKYLKGKLDGRTKLKNNTKGLLS
jgi:nucleoside-diphosphate-sugar epimerase|tara:strand:- start:5593 stop:6387 length:795 start_codon:yes stop_codon:yes gene_type:complete